LVGLVIFFLTLTPILHYTGAWGALYLPMSDSSTYDNTGLPYNTTRILNPDFTLDEEAYTNYSPIYVR
jgi:hypothetical protein